MASAKETSPRSLPVIVFCVFPGPVYRFLGFPQFTTLPGFSQLASFPGINRHQQRISPRSLKFARNRGFLSPVAYFSCPPRSPTPSQFTRSLGFPSCPLFPKIPVSLVSPDKLKFHTHSNDIHTVICSCFVAVCRPMRVFDLHVPHTLQFVSSSCKREGLCFLSC